MTAAHLMVHENPVILVVDDQAESRGFITQELSLAGFSVTEARLGADALRLAQAEQPDLVLLRLRLPDMSGRELCLQLKTAFTTGAVPILFVSGRGESLSQQDQVEAFEAGALGFLELCQDPKLMVAQVRAHTVAHRSKKALNRQSVLADLTTQCTAEALFVMDEQGRLTFMNPAAEQILGWKEEELLGKVLHDHVHYKRPDGTLFPMHDCHLGAVLTSAHTVEKSNDVWVRKDGSFVTVRVSCSPVIENGKVAGAVLAMHDSGELRKAESELQRSQAIMHSILDSMSEGCFGLGSDWTFSFINRTAALTALTVGKPDLIGKNIWEEFPSLLGTRYEESYRKAMRERVVERFEEFHEPRGIWYEVNVYPARDGGIAIYSRDVTERKETELKFQRAIQARDEVLSTVSHDLRNPIVAIELNTGLVLRRLSNDESLDYVRKALGAVRSSTQRMNSLINDLLEISRIDSGVLELQRASVSVRQILEDAVELIEGLAAQKSIHLETDFSCGHVEVDCDSNRIHQVFSNLLGNAIRYTAEGGVIAMRCQLKGELAEFEIQDTGIGIAEAQLPHVFDRFWQAKHQKRGGAGLGLAIAKGIIEAHGGQISVRSTLGQGTTFSFTVPQVGPVSAGLTRTHEQTPSDAGERDQSQGS